MSGEEESAAMMDRIVTLLFDKGAVDGASYTVARETIGEALGLEKERLESALRELAENELVGWLEEEGTWYCYLRLKGVQRGKLLGMKEERASGSEGRKETDGITWNTKLSEMGTTGTVLAAVMLAIILFPCLACLLMRML